MVVARSVMAGEVSHAAETALLREYYGDGEYVSKPEGIMKILAVLGCICSGVVFLARGGCAGASWLVAGGASVALGGAALLALQLAAALLQAPRAAPHLWLYTDMVFSSVLGAALLVSGVLSLMMCELSAHLAFAHAPLALLNALLVTGSAVATYRAVTRRWDAARGPAWEPRRAPPADLDV